MSYLIPKLPLLKTSSCTKITERAHNFLKGHVIALLEFELNCKDPAFQYSNYYATGIPQKAFHTIFSFSICACVRACVCVCVRAWYYYWVWFTGTFTLLNPKNLIRTIHYFLNRSIDHSVEQSKDSGSFHVSNNYTWLWWFCKYLISILKSLSLFKSSQSQWMNSWISIISMNSSLFCQYFFHNTFSWIDIISFPYNLQIKQKYFAESDIYFFFKNCNFLLNQGKESHPRSVIQ